MVYCYITICIYYFFVISASATTSLSNQSVVGSKQNSAASTDDQTTTSDVKSKRQPSSNTSSQNVQVNKKKRVREQWSIEDKNHFFEAVAVVSSEIFYTSRQCIYFILFFTTKAVKFCTSRKSTLMSKNCGLGDCYCCVEIAELC